MYMSTSMMRRPKRDRCSDSRYRMTYCHGIQVQHSYLNCTKIYICLYVIMLALWQTWFGALAKLQMKRL